MGLSLLVALNRQGYAARRAVYPYPKIINALGLSAHCHNWAGYGDKPSGFALILVYLLGWVILYTNLFEL